MPPPAALPDALPESPFQGATADPFGDLIPKSGDLESLTPRLEEYGPFHDLVKANDPAPEASMAYDNLVGGGTKDAEAYQKVGENFSHVPRGVAVSTTDYGPFADLAGKGRDVPATNYDDQFGIFADMVPRSPAPEVDDMAVRARLLAPMLRGPVHEATPEESAGLINRQFPRDESSLLVKLSDQERKRVISGEANAPRESISAAPRREQFIEPTPEGRPDKFNVFEQGPGSAFVAGVGHEAILALGDIVQGVAGLGVQHPGLKEDATAKDKMDWLNTSPDPLLQWARQTPELAEKAFPIAPGEKEVGELGKAVGGFIPLVAAGPFGPFAIAMQNAGATIENNYKALVASGMNPEKAARQTFQAATVAGLTDEVVWSVLPHPLRVAGDRFIVNKFGSDMVRRFLAGRVAQGTEGAVLGAASRMAQNTVAGEDLLEGVTQSAAGLGVIQAFLPRGTHAIGERDAIQKPSATREVPRPSEGREDVTSDTGRVGESDTGGETTRETPPIEKPPETPKEEAPLTPRDIATALVDDEGNILEQSPVGQAKTHQQLFEQAKGKPHEEAALNAFVDDSRHIFVDKNGKQLSRGNLKELFGFEHSADLIEAQKLQVRDELRKRSSDYQQKKTDAIAETMKLAGDTGGVEMQSNTQPDRKLIISPDPAEPGKWRVTKIDKDGPYGHHIFDSREAALAAASGDSGSALVKGPNYFTLGEFKVTRVRPTAETKPPPTPPSEPPVEDAVPEPPKNDAGVYDPEENQAEVIEYKPKAKSNREKAKIRILQVGPEKWISAIDYSTPIEGRSGPLSVNSKVFPTRDAALEDAAGELSGHFERGLLRKDANATEQKRLTRLKAWTDDILLRQKGKAHLDKLIRDARQGPEVTPDTAIDKIEKKVDQVAPRTAAAIKTEIIARVQGAIDKLKEDDTVTITQSEYDPNRYEVKPSNENLASTFVDINQEKGKFVASFRDRGESTTSKVTGESLAEVLDNIKARFSQGEGKITFHIPGDGTFTLARDGKVLADLLRRAKAMKTGEAPIKTESRQIKSKREGYVAPPEDYYAQQLHETMGKEAALKDQREQLAQVKKGSEAAKLIQKTIEALGRFPDEEKPPPPPPPPPEPETGEPPPGPYHIVKSTPASGKATYGIEQGASYADKFIGKGPKNPYGEYGMTKAQAEKRLAELNARTAEPEGATERSSENGNVQGATITPAAPVTSAAEAGVPPKVGPKGTVSQGAPPLKPLPPTSVKTPKSQRQIITDLARALNVPFRFGRLKHRFSGYFLPTQNLIASKHPDHIPIAMHEFGHKFDREFKMSEDKTIAGELNVLGDPGTGGSMSSWTKSKSKKYKMGEGVAEFIRYWLTDPEHAEAVAPNTFKLFESLLDANKDLGDKFRQAQSDIEALRSEEGIGSQISVGENPNKTPYTMRQLTRDLVDDLHFVRLAFMEAKAASGPISAFKDAYILARNLRGSYGMAGTFVRDGVVDFTTKKVTLGTSLQDALKPVAGRIDDFRQWIVAKRAQELMRLGKETGLRVDRVTRTAKRFENDTDFQKAFADLKVWRTHLVKYAVDSGLISSKSALKMLRLYQDYVPLHRIFEVGAGEPPSQEGGGPGRGLNVGKPGSFRSLTGSRRQIVDPIETLIKDAYTIITASEKTAINHAVANLANKPEMGRWVERIAEPKEMVKVGLEKVREQLENAGADLGDVDDDLALMFFRNGKQAPFGENTIRIMRNDKPEFYRLNKDLFETFNALDLEDNGRLIRILAQPGQLLRSGVILEPSFAIANVLRDVFSSAVISRHGAFPFEAPIKGALALLRDPEIVARWKASGGSNAIELNYFDRQKMQQFVQERITLDFTPMERAMIVTKSPLTALRYLTAFSEEATRIGEFKIAYDKYTKSGMSEGEASRLSAFESRDRQDFAKGGAKTKIARALTPFWNAALQGNVALAQAFKLRPARTILQGLAFVTIPKMIEQAVNWNDQDYWDRPQWERDLFFMIPAGKDSTGHTRFIRVPTPFEVGLIFGTGPGRMMQGLKEGSADAMKDFPLFFLKQSTPNPMPQGLQIIFEDFMAGKQGWDIYRGRPIVPDSLAGEAPELQFTEQTSALAKKVGAQLGLSPMKIDHIISQTTGGMGKLLTGAQAPGKRFISTPLRASSQTIENFYERLADLEAEASRVEAGTSRADVGALSDFRAAAREMGELRTASRLATDKRTKEQLQEQIYQTARATLKALPPPR